MATIPTVSTMLEKWFLKLTSFTEVLLRQGLSEHSVGWSFCGFVRFGPFRSHRRYLGAEDLSMASSKIQPNGRSKVTTTAQMT
jgi:hypothetical protein